LQTLYANGAVKSTPIPDTNPKPGTAAVSALPAP